MITLIFTVLLGARAVLGTQESCGSGKFTTSGECCIQCQPGEGVLEECGESQTVCMPCLDSEYTWNSCKQNKQGAGIRAGTANPSQTPSPEGEKLHSDSGISVDSQSLQEQLQQGTHTVVKIDGGVSCLALPLHTREEVEKLLSQGCEGEGHEVMEETDWCSLAVLLGYEEERIATFRQEERPIQALLSDWASQDSASVDTLCTALRKINRDDIVQSLGIRPTATSAV
ncbi:nerve growth factor receptor b [Clupea harengus]|uniref:Nerve growth factor receptor b n=1 Tax=Clupea harengus TaxID=7950 RepID=A0A8M1KLB8_CLUHA|nr:nerve growth factor receptor b [Clupea harengus]